MEYTEMFIYAHCIAHILCRNFSLVHIFWGKRWHAQRHTQVTLRKHSFAPVIHVYTITLIYTYRVHLFRDRGIDHCAWEIIYINPLRFHSINIKKIINPMYLFRMRPDHFTNKTHFARQKMKTKNGSMPELAKC